MYVKQRDAAICISGILALDVNVLKISGIDLSSWLQTRNMNELIIQSLKWIIHMNFTHFATHTISDTYLFVKHIAAKHFSAGICNIVYRVVIKRANNGIAPALHSIF